MVSEPVTSVFISSTIKDLSNYRQAATDAIKSLGYVPIAMEALADSDGDLLAARMRQIAAADVFLGIYAYHYGEIPEGHKISITEMEYNRAAERCLPRLCFLLDKQHPWPPRYVDIGDEASKLRQFKSRINVETVRATFTTSETLQVQVAKALLGIFAKPTSEHIKFGTLHDKHVHGIAEKKATLRLNIQDANIDVLSSVLGLTKEDIQIQLVQAD